MTPSAIGCSGENPRSQWQVLPGPQVLWVPPAHSLILGSPPPPTPSSSSLSPPVGACKALPTSPLGVDCCSLQSIPHLAASGPINHPLPKAQECSHCSQLPQYEPGSPTLPCLIECHLPLHPCTPAIPEYVHALTRLGACLIPSPFVIRNNPLI